MRKENWSCVLALPKSNASVQKCANIGVLLSFPKPSVRGARVAGVAGEGAERKCGHPAEWKRFSLSSQTIFGLFVATNLLSLRSLHPACRDPPKFLSRSSEFHASFWAVVSGVERMAQGVCVSIWAENGTITKTYPGKHTWKRGVPEGVRHFLFC